MTDIRAEAFCEKIKLMKNGCWNWLGKITNNGYGIFYKNGKEYLAHRFAYETNKMIIPTDLVIDHLCRNRRCVNPDHLEAVTERVNILRGNCPSAIAFKKQFCKNGHIFDNNNTMIISRGERICKNCKNRVYRGRNQCYFCKISFNDHDDVLSIVTGKIRNFFRLAHVVCFEEIYV